MAKIINFIGPVHMGRQHNGLREEAEINGLSLDSLDRGEFLVFISSKGTRYKAYGPNNAFIDHNLHPLTLSEYLTTTGNKLDVGLEKPIEVSLSRADKDRLAVFFEVMNENKRNRNKTKTKTKTKNKKRKVT